MKNLTKISAIIVFGSLLMNCSNSKMERRIAQLENRVTKIESNRDIKKTTTLTPPNSNITTPSEAEEKPSGLLPVFTFNEEVYDFGKINEGDIVEYSFEFKNTGQIPLIISNATGSCGCTVPEWPKEPIGIGETATIKVEFNSSKKPGIQNKTVTITANTFPKQTRLKIKANVIPKNNADLPS